MPVTPLKSLAVVALALGVMAQSPAPDALARARAAYNAGKYDDAIADATEALKSPTLANAAALVLGRANLERYRQTDAPADMEHAREALRLVVPDLLAPRDHVEFLVGLGVSLYLDGCDGCFAAAAELFERALARTEPGADRDRVFEWWAGSLDLQAQYGPEFGRMRTYRRILDRAEAEIARDDRSAPAAYWLVAASRGVGDLERAWGAAITGWVRARSDGARGDALRADLDRFVTQVLLPERARDLSPDGDSQAVLDRLLEQWEEIKKKYV